MTSICLEISKGPLSCLGLNSALTHALVLKVDQTLTFHWHIGYSPVLLIFYPECCVRQQRHPGSQERDDPEPDTDGETTIMIIGVAVEAKLPITGREEERELENPKITRESSH